VGNEMGNRAGLLRRLGVGITASAFLLTGCSAGQIAQTVQQTPSIDGEQAEVGNIAIRAAGIASPESGTSYSKGASAPLRMVIVNRGGQQDTLVSVTSPVTSGSQLSAATSASGSSSGSGSSDSASVSASSARTASPSTSDSGSASPAASGSGSSAPIVLPGQQSVQIGMSTGTATVMLTGLTAELFPAQSVPVTFTFGSGASVTVVLAVQLSSTVPTAPTVSVATQAGGE